MNEMLAISPHNNLDIKSFFKNDYTWCIEYTDGYIEQGGFSLGDNWRTITLYKPYSDTNYLILLTQRTTDKEQNHTHCALHPTTKTINSFYCNAWGAGHNSPQDGIFYYCAGY